MKQNKGMSLNNKPVDMPEGFYSYGKNGLLNKISNVVSNEKGFKKLMSYVPSGYIVNGVIETGEERVILTFTNNVNSGLLLYNLKLQSLEYMFQDITVDYTLDFKVDNYITGEVQRNFKGDLICAFTDKVTFPKYINLDSPRVASLSEWKLFPNVSSPNINAYVQEGASTSIGSYYIAVRYKSQDGTETHFSHPYGGVVITSDGGEMTAGKSIIVELLDYDRNYDFVEIAIIGKVNGTNIVKITTPLPAEGDVIRFEYSDSTPMLDSSLEEVLTEPIAYDTVKTMGQLNNSLYVGNLGNSPNDYNLQKYANMIKLLFRSSLVDVGQPDESMKSGKTKSLLHNEVYAFYVRYFRTDGRRTKAFIIPGTTPTEEDLSWNPLMDGRYYEIADRIHEYNPTYRTGAFGPYVNKTETYPDTEDFDSTSLGGMNLRGQKVRHHKTPSLRFCRDKFYYDEPKFGVSKLPILEVISTNVILPPEFPDIIGYEILYAKRTIHNMTNYGQGVVIFSSEKSPSPDGNIYTNGNNWNIRSMCGDYVISKKAARFYSFDLMFNKPGIAPTHLEFSYKLETLNKKKYNVLDVVEGETLGKALYLADSIQDSTISTLSPVNYWARVDESKYVKNHSKVDNIDNTYGETSLVLKISDVNVTTSAFPDASSSAGGCHAGFPGMTMPAEIEVPTWFADLKVIKSDVYKEFYTQELIPLGNVEIIGDGGSVSYGGNLVMGAEDAVIRGGDMFISDFTFHTYGIIDTKWREVYSTGDGTWPPDWRIRVIAHRVAMQTAGNLFARYEIPGNIYSKWYPNNSAEFIIHGSNWDRTYFSLYNGTVDPNQFGYHRGLEGINDLIFSSIYHPYTEYLYKFPYRIHRLGRMSKDNTRSWRSSLALDYYEVTRDKGEIVNIDNFDDRLLIHTERTLLVTQDKATLDSGSLGVTLGSGDIFQFDPKEVRYAKLGYGGTQHDIACYKTPAGYVYPDAQAGEFFVYNSEGIISLGQGLKEFLKRFLRVKGVNPFNKENHITIGYDQENERVLLTVKNKEVEGREVFEISRDDISSVDESYNIELSSSAVGGNRKVKPGDVVFMESRYLEYLGANDSIYDCPKTDEVNLCDPPINLKLTLGSDGVGRGYFTNPSSESATFQFKVRYQRPDGEWPDVTIGTVTVAGGAEHMITFATEKDFNYELSVFRICQSGLSITSTVKALNANTSRTPKEPGNSIQTASLTTTFDNQGTISQKSKITHVRLTITDADEDSVILTEIGGNYDDWDLSETLSELDFKGPRFQRKVKVELMESETSLYGTSSQYTVGVTSAWITAPTISSEGWMVEGKPLNEYSSGYYNTFVFDNVYVGPMDEEFDLTDPTWGDFDISEGSVIKIKFE